MATILVADDHPQIVRLLQRELEIAGYPVITAADGEEALRQVEEHRPALVVLDIMMPGINGFRVLNAIRDNPDTRETIVVLLTGLDHPEEVRFGLEAGADWYMTKPFRPGDVTDLARRFLGEPRPIAAGGAVTPVRGDERAFCCACG